MALFFNPRFRALDDNGNPLSGATLTFYIAGTTTPANIYRDAALLTPASNPTTGSDAADASGWFPQFFADESTICDAILKDADGVTVQTYEDVPFVGATLNTRERLSADRTYYVATTGSDVANDGLSVGSPYLTVQKAVDVAKALDLNGFRVTIQVADGTYSGQVVLNGPCIGQTQTDNFLIQGNMGTPANVVFSYNGSGSTITCQGGARAVVQGVKFSGGASTTHLRVEQLASCGFQAVDFGVALAHVYVRAGGYGSAFGNYTISGGASYHFETEFGGLLRAAGITATLTGTPAFATAFAAALGGRIEARTVSFSGSATGPRYSATLSGAIDTNGGGASYFPGNAAGTTATGGQYV